MIDITQPNMILMKDGVEVSRHRSAVEAMEKAAESGAGTYTLVRPDATIVVDGFTPDPVDPSPIDPDPVEPDPVDPDPQPDPVDPEPPVSGEGFESMLTFRGAFKVPGSVFGDSEAVYTNGTFCVSEDKSRLWIAGKIQDHAVGEFTIPDLVETMDTAEMNAAVNLTPFTTLNVLDPDYASASKRISGMREIDGKLYVNQCEYYDANSDNWRHTAVLDIASGEWSGYFRTFPDHNAFATGWVQPIPSDKQALFGDMPYLMGYSVNVSIEQRLSHGPSFYTWDGVSQPIYNLTPYMWWPHTDRLHPDWNNETGENDLWTSMSRAFVGFIHGDDYIAVGRSGGHRTYIGYKLTTLQGNVKGGNHPYDETDFDNYFWRFRLSDIASASDPKEPKPYEYGPLSTLAPLYQGRGFFNNMIAHADYVDGTLYLLCMDDGGDIRKPVVYVYDVAE